MGKGRGRAGDVTSDKSVVIGKPTIMLLLRPCILVMLVVTKGVHSECYVMFDGVSQEYFRFDLRQAESVRANGP